MKFSIENFILNNAGKILMITGVLGIIFDVRYDVIVEREIVFGPMQVACAIYCCFLIYAGYIFDDFLREMR